MTIRVVVADDQAMVRAGFSALLDAQDDIEVVGAAATGLEAVRLIAETEVDVVLMDVRMPVMDGLEATARIVATASDGPRILILTTFDIDSYVYEALRAGASGFLLKDALPSDLVAGVRIVAAGDALLAPSVTRRLIAEFASRRATVASGVASAALTPRENEVLVLIGRGLSNAEIAQELVLAEQTVKTHVSRIFMKVGLRDRVQAVVYAYESGIVVAGGA